MSLFSPEPAAVPRHPRKEPRVPGPLTASALADWFSGCADFDRRPVLIGGDPDKAAVAYFIQGQVRTERMNDYILRPLAISPILAKADRKTALDRMLRGAVYSQTATACTTLDQAVSALVDGAVVLDFPGDGTMVAYAVPTEEKRSVSAPEDEPSVMGAKDAFVESLRTNTSLVRRRLRAPELRIAEVTVGRQSLTPVDVLSIEGLTDPALTEEVLRRLERIDTGHLLEPACLEEQLVDEVDTAFPMIACTSGRTGSARGWRRAGWGSWRTASPRGICSPAPWGSSSAPGRTGPRTGSRPRLSRSCGMPVCSCPCFSRRCMWRR